MNYAVRLWSWFRDPMSGLTHLSGAVVAAIATMSVVLHSAPGVRFVASAVFGFSLVLLLLASSAYHLLPLSPAAVRKLRKLDHSSIYVFIAASFTPSCLLLLGDRQGPWVLGVVWSAAALGVLFKLFVLQASRWLTVAPYFAMSGMAVFVVPDLARLLSPAGYAWMWAGAVSYGVGGIVYALKRPDPWPGFFGFHEVWHLLVLAGAYCHFHLTLECLTR
jgi:hemolysin III